MLTTQAHSPAAALDLLRMLSALKLGLLMYSFSHTSTQLTGTLSLSKLSRLFRKASTLPMYFLPAAQLRSLGTLPPGAVRVMHAATTCVHPTPKR